MSVCVLVRLFPLQNSLAHGVEHASSKAANLKRKYFQPSTPAQLKHAVMEIQISYSS